MIVYMDTSALVKRYVEEQGSDEISELFTKELLAGTSIITYVEMSAALSKAVRIGLLDKDEAFIALRAFRSEWNQLIHIQLNEPLIVRAAFAAWDYGLRGYDATHLASAFFWQELIGEPITMATYDKELWYAAKKMEMKLFPERL